MNTTALKLVRRHFSSEMVPRALNRRNALAWVKARRVLGDKWLLAQPMPKGA